LKVDPDLSISGPAPDRNMPYQGTVTAPCANDSSCREKQPLHNLQGIFSSYKHEADSGMICPLVRRQLAWISPWR